MITSNPYRYASSGGGFNANLAWEFNGTNEHIFSASGSASTISGDWTLSAWAYRTTGRTDTIISTPSYLLQMNFGQYFFNWGGPNISSTGFPLSAWTHIMIVYVDSTKTASLYADNVFKSSGTAGVSQTGGIQRIGASGAGIFWEGKIREVSVFDSAADATLRSFLYNSGTPQDLTGQSNLYNYYGAWNCSDGASGIPDMGSDGLTMEFLNMDVATNVVPA